MVKKLKDNIGYITYIRGEMKKSFPDWHEMDAVYENQPNNNFQISFVKDLNSILKSIPEQDSKWKLTLCTELIDYYMTFIKKYFIRN